MCQTPGLLPDGTEFACRKCKQCQEHRVNDWVGRCIAEKTEARACHFITLTYGPDEEGNSEHFRSSWLTYSDVQKYFKTLRKQGFKFRYIVCGEYGSDKGRAHWHLLMFWQGKVPPHKLSSSKYFPKRFNDNNWPRGYQLWEPVTPKSVRYVCKYINKDIGKDERQAHMSVSKKPPLGDAFFRRLAQKYVDAGLAPQTSEYRFPQVKAKDGKPKAFFMRGTTLRNFLEYYKTAWAQTHQSHHPVSDLIEAHDDRLARGTYDPVKGQWGVKVYPPDDGSEPRVGNDPLNPSRVGSLYSDLNGYRWWYRQTEDEWSWQKGEKLPESPKEKRLRESLEYEKAKARFNEPDQPPGSAPSAP